MLDPFMGSGSTLVAAARTGRRYVGYDLDPAYVETARVRVGAVDDAGRHDGTSGGAGPAHPTLWASAAAEQRAQASGMSAPAIARQVLTEAGFTIRAAAGRGARRGVAADLVAYDAADQPWFFEVSGAFTTTGGGLLRTDAVWRALGRALVLVTDKHSPVVLLTSHLPRPGSDGDRAIRSAGPATIFDAVEMLADDGRARLARYAAGGHGDRASPGFWTARQLRDG